MLFLKIIKSELETSKQELNSRERELTTAQDEMKLLNGTIADLHTELQSTSEAKKSLDQKYLDEVERHGQTCQDLRKTQSG